MESEATKTTDPRYAPPYPQKFHAYWPGHVVKAGAFVLIVYLLIGFLAYKFALPTDPVMPPMPDDGMYIPGPEWYYLFLLQPFWYMTGDMKELRYLATFIVPLTVLLFVLFAPLLLKKLTMKGILWRVLAFTPFVMIAAGIIFSGYPAKTMGCPSCHNPYMGVRQALPPMNIAEFYKTDRQRQIDVGKYRASKMDEAGGDVRGQEESYKDANWQMRHFYEPTFTW